MLTAGTVVAVGCLLGASMAGYGLLRWYGVDRVDVDLESSGSGRPVNILLVGSDSREGESPGEAAAVTGRRTDTIMVIRLDPASEQVSVVSFPRDLWLPIAGTGETGRINSAYDEADEQQVLIDTIRENFAIDIHHWIEVDFQGFRELVDAIGGVTLYFDRGLRDRDSGLHIYDLGCVTLDGEMALAYARSRKAEYDTADGWVSDPQSDLSRIQRQQNLMTEALKEALDQASNPLRLRRLIDIGASNVTIDGALGLGDIRRLAERFRDLDPDDFDAVALPVVPRPGDEGATVVVDERAAQPVLDVFRGREPGEVRPEDVEVTVLNGTMGDPAGERDTLASDVTGDLEGIGFAVGEPGNADEVQEHSTVRYSPGQEAYAQLVARHVDVGVTVVEDPALELGQVTLVAGLDFGGVHEEPTPVEDLPAPPGTTGSTAPPPSATETTGTSLPDGPSTTTPAQVGAVPGDAC